MTSINFSLTRLGIKLPTFYIGSMRSTTSGCEISKYIEVIANRFSYVKVIFFCTLANLEAVGQALSTPLKAVIFTSHPPRVYYVNPQSQCGKYGRQTRPDLATYTHQQQQLTELPITTSFLYFLVHHVQPLHS